MEVKDWIDSELGVDIWTRKYQYNDETFEQWLDRISNHNSVIKERIRKKQFLFGGRILASRGLQKDGRKITFSNCYVVSSPEDNIESIFDTSKALARTFSYGGGCGVDISKLRPKGTKVNNAAKETTGATSFMDLYSLTTEIIGQSGRRGALMISIDSSHPDIEEFIDIKTDLNKVTKANISIKSYDDFMQAVRSNTEYELYFKVQNTGEEIKKKVNARNLFMKLAKNNWDFAEPGLLYWDRICNWNLLSEDESFEYASVNPCAEEPLPAGGSCLLGSINLSEFVNDEFCELASFNYIELDETVRDAVTALNEVLDEGLPLHPLASQRESVGNWRQIGLGFFGLSDLLIKLGIKYGEPKSIEFCERMAKQIINSALQQSAILASKYGTYPNYKEEYILLSPFLNFVAEDETIELIKKYGLRNSQLLTVAPTGSLSTMLGVSGGIEPIYNYGYERTTQSLHKEEVKYMVYTPIVKRYMELKGLSSEKQLPDFFTNAMELDYHKRINMQAIWQMYIDASISSTVNLPNSATVEEVANLYIEAWEKGLKGITIFRDGCARIGILNNIKEEEPIEENQKYTIDNLPWGTTIAPSNDMIGKKRSIMSGCGKIHVQCWFDPYDGRCMEVFLAKGSSGGCNSFMLGLSRMTSLALRTGANFESVIDQLNSTPTCPSYAVRSATKKDTSKGNCCPTALGYAIREMQYEVFDELGITEDEVYESPKIEKTVNHTKEAKKETNKKALCPKCGGELKFEGGCNSCLECGYSKCE